jgi:hypothetical protein
MNDTGRESLAVKAWIFNKISNHETASISLYMLERNLPDEVPPLRYVQYWANGVCRELGCTATIHPLADVVTFYPRGMK